MAIDESYLLELRSRADIESIVSAYVSLKRKGKILTGLCPFHNEKRRPLPFTPKRSLIIVSAAATAAM